MDHLPVSIERYLEAIYRRDRPGAAVHVAASDEALLERGFGLAALPEVQVETGSVFRIGSLTKQLTAVAVLQLVDRGQLTLTTSVASALGLDAEVLRGIEIHHLLAHASGLRPSDGESWDGPPPSSDELLYLILGTASVAKPGERWLYTDWGYVLLGLLVERRAGMVLGDFFRKYFFAPLGMENTCYCPGVPPAAVRCVADYRQEQGGYVATDWSKLRPPFGEAAVLSTVGDLARWSRGLETGRILRPETLAQAQTPYRLTDGRTIPYGFGFALSKIGGERIAEHGGNIGGFRAHLLTSQPTGLFIAILANAADNRPSPSYVADRVARILLGQPLREGNTAFPPGILERYVGTYVAAGTEIVITLENSRLLCAHGGYRRELIWQDVGVFVPRHTLTTVRFEGMAHGPAGGLSLIPRYGEAVVAERASDRLEAEDLKNA